jgi:hypothetical protein
VFHNITVPRFLIDETKTHYNSALLSARLFRKAYSTLFQNMFVRTTWSSLIEEKNAKKMEEAHPMLAVTYNMCHTFEQAKSSYNCVPAMYSIYDPLKKKLNSIETLSKTIWRRDDKIVSVDSSKVPLLYDAAEVAWKNLEYYLQIGNCHFCGVDLSQRTDPSAHACIAAEEKQLINLRNQKRPNPSNKQLMSKRMRS